ncbi:Spx/MgsR family RNA polymerase-binding regulatory protein [Barrientosiimonas marina]|uniref:Transcriptional regulator Spx n=1 Tax=Lentibacillus kimchii TaxID=1542911 RepID=A0ABW2URM5_9BACI
MTVTIYGTPCLSARKAKEWLTDHAIPYAERNTAKVPLTLHELQAILRLTLNGTDDIISTRSNVYKDLQEDISTLSLKQLLDLIQTHPGLLRNPIMIDEKRLQIGFNAEEIRQFIPRKMRETEWLNWRLNHLWPVEG